MPHLILSVAAATSCILGQRLAEASPDGVSLDDSQVAHMAFKLPTPLASWRVETGLGIRFDWLAAAAKKPGRAILTEIDCSAEPRWEQTVVRAPFSAFGDEVSDLTFAQALQGRSYSVHAAPAETAPFSVMRRSPSTSPPEIFCPGAEQPDTEALGIASDVSLFGKVGALPDRTNSPLAEFAGQGTRWVFVRDDSHRLTQMSARLPSETTKEAIHSFDRVSRLLASKALRPTYATEWHDSYSAPDMDIRYWQYVIADPSNAMPLHVMLSLIVATHGELNQQIHEAELSVYRE